MLESNIVRRVGYNIYTWLYMYANQLAILKSSREQVKENGHLVYLQSFYVAGCLEPTEDYSGYILLTEHNKLVQTFVCQHTGIPFVLYLNLYKEKGFTEDYQLKVTICQVDEDRKPSSGIPDLVAIVSLKDLDIIPKEIPFYFLHATTSLQKGVEYCILLEFVDVFPSKKVYWRYNADNTFDKGISWFRNSIDWTRLDASFYHRLLTLSLAEFDAVKNNYGVFTCLSKEVPFLMFRQEYCGFLQRFLEASFLTETKSGVKKSIYAFNSIYPVITEDYEFRLGWELNDNYYLLGSELNPDVYYYFVAVRRASDGVWTRFDKSRVVKMDCKNAVVKGLKWQVLSGVDAFRIYRAYADIDLDDEYVNKKFYLLEEFEVTPDMLVDRFFDTGQYIVDYTQYPQLVGQDEIVPQVEIDYDIVSVRCGIAIANQFDVIVFLSDEIKYLKDIEEVLNLQKETVEIFKFVDTKSNVVFWDIIGYIYESSFVDVDKWYISHPGITHRACIIQVYEHKQDEVFQKLDYSVLKVINTYYSQVDFSSQKTGKSLVLGGKVSKIDEETYFGDLWLRWNIYSSLSQGVEYSFQHNWNSYVLVFCVDYNGGVIRPDLFEQDRDSVKIQINQCPSGIYHLYILAWADEYFLVPSIGSLVKGCIKQKLIYNTQDKYWHISFGIDIKCVQILDLDTFGVVIPDLDFRVVAGTVTLRFSENKNIMVTVIGTY